MLKVHLGQWQQTPETLREMALQAQHPRIRERWLAIYRDRPTQVAYRSERNPQTVMERVHRYHAHEPEALAYYRSGGHLPLCLMRSRTG
jgi:hypothetical protein